MKSIDLTQTSRAATLMGIDYQETNRQGVEAIITEVDGRVLPPLVAGGTVRLRSGAAHIGVHVRALLHLEIYPLVAEVSMEVNVFENEMLKMHAHLQGKEMEI